MDHRRLFLVGDYLDPPNLITAGNIALGLCSTYFATQHNVSLTAALLVAAAVIDHLDGFVARKFFSLDEDARQFGAHLDTLADATNFSLVPAILLITSVPPLYLSFPTALLFALAGVLRLAHFEVVGAVGGRIYSGFPTTYAAYVSAFIFLALDRSLISPPAAIAIIAAIALLQVANIRVRKPNYIVTLTLMPIVFAIYFVVTQHISDIW